MPPRNRSNELKLTRVFDAPLKAVWNAWVDPAQAAHWWGPRGFTITTHSKDFRPGGRWVYTMHGRDGTDYPNIATYLEVKEYESMVYDHGATETTPPLFRVTVLFKESGGKTTMDMTMALATPEAADAARKFIKKASGDSTWDRLAEYLVKQNAGREVFIINRSFVVPVERMFRMWSDAEHLSRWLPPEGMEMEVLRGEIRPGGSLLARMYGQGIEFYHRAGYREVTPNRIVYTHQFVDQEERLSHHPHAPQWPETILTTVNFTEEGPDQTRVTVAWELAESVANEELAFFMQARSGVMEGWTGSFDKLEGLLVEQQVA